MWPRMTSSEGKPRTTSVSSSSSQQLGEDGTLATPPSNGALATPPSHGHGSLSKGQDIERRQSGSSRGSVPSGSGSYKGSFLSRVMTAASSAAKDFGMTDEEIDQCKSAGRTLSAELIRVATTPVGLPEAGRLGAGTNSLERPESLQSVSEGTEPEPAINVPAEQPEPLEGIASVTSFTDDLKGALDEAIRSRSPQLDTKTLSNIGLTGSDTEWEAAHMRTLRYEFKECMRLVLAIKESVSEQMHESQSFSNVLLAQRLPTIKKFTKIANVYCERLIGFEAKAYKLIGPAAEFDLSETERGNGYRSLLKIFAKCLQECNKRLSEFLLKRNRVLGYNVDEAWLFFVDYLYILDMLGATMDIASDIYSKGSGHHLFVEGFFEDLVKVAKELPTSYFYGRRFGFQYPVALAQAFTLILSALTAFGEAQKFSDNDILQHAGSLLLSGKYLLDGHSRGKDLSAAFDNTDIESIKKFWNLTDSPVAKHAAKLFAPLVSVNRVLQLPVVGVEVPARDSSATKTIRPIEESLPHAFQTVQVRLLSFAWREGQVSVNSHIQNYDAYLKHYAGRWEKGVSNSLIVHIHGGGFVAQSSQSHEVYLRMWAKQTDVPILSIDYSLAPEFKFPRQVNECFYAYCWALANARMLGTTAEKVIVCGDSAGGNLSAAVALMCIQKGVRLPDAILPIYGALNVGHTASPSRLMSIMDPLLPYGILLTCLEAYAHRDDLEKNEPLLSPNSSPEDLLSQLCPVLLAAAELDPLLDDTVAFGTKLRRLGRLSRYHVFEDLPHGFLNLTGHSLDCRRASEILGTWIADALGIKCNAL